MCSFTASILAGICCDIQALFSPESAVLVRLSEAQFESTKWVARFESGVSNRDVAKEVSSNATLKARLKQSLSDMYSVRRGSVRDALFQQHRYLRLMSRYSVSSDLEIRRKRDKLCNCRRRC